jgi:tRNA(Ile)-lysidine synthetase-like protein
MSWVQLEHLVWTQYKNNRLGLAQPVPLILTVSGGLDSMALLNVVSTLKFTNKIIVAHFHHGSSADQEQSQFRGQAFDLVKKTVDSKFELRFHRAEKALGSEADFRRERQRFIKSVLSDYPNAIVVTGHHQNDLLETYFLKLIRGAGIEGLKNFKSFNGKIWRPFLTLQKLELQNYANLKRLVWVNDPSNEKSHYLRNWLRREFFPLLESKHSGAVRNLLKSLDRLVDSSSAPARLSTFPKLSMKSKESCVIEINRPDYLLLTADEKEKVIFLAFKQAQDYKFKTIALGPVSSSKNSSFWDLTSGRVKEICKRLDKNQKDIKFTLGQLKALTTSKKIMLEFKM